MRSRSRDLQQLEQLPQNATRARSRARDVTREPTVTDRDEPTPYTEVPPVAERERPRVLVPRRVVHDMHERQVISNLHFAQWSDWACRA